jgi:GYF domain 2
MSQRIFYEIDGRVHGPINLTQLQLMAASGMLLPHHRVKREGTELWFPAQNVRGLFTDSTPAPSPAIPVGAALPQPVASAVAASPESPSADEEIPFGGFGAVEADPGDGLNPAFDFFSDEPEASQPPKPAKAGKQPKSAKAAAKTPEPQAFELLENDAPGTVADSTIEPIPNPHGPARTRNDDMPKTETIDPPKASGSKGAGAKQADVKSEAKNDTKGDIAVAPAPASAAEISGRAVDIMPDDSLNLLDGKTTFRLHRSWLLVTSRFSDGSTRSTYLRLQQIDAGILDQRPNTSRGRAGPTSLLSFTAGSIRVGLVFQGSDKLYRTFLERVLLLGNVASALPKPAGKA